MSFYSDEEVDNQMEIEERPSRSKSPSPRAIADAKSSSSGNAGLIAGVVLAGVGIAAAVGARIILKKKPTVAPARPSQARTEGRRRVPPRRARSTASGTSSLQHR